MASNWIKADFRFDPRRATLVLPYHESRKLAEELEAIRDSPDALEDFARQLIINARPELAEACIYFVRFNPETCAWEFSVTHPTLPRCLPGCYAKRMELIPTDETTGKEPTDADTEG